MSGAPYIRVGFLGFGTVGSGAYRMLEDNREAIARKVGAEIEVVRIGVRDEAKKRCASPSLLTTDLGSVVDHREIDVIVEAMGGLDPAGELIERALRRGKHVVTANKELIARRGAELVGLAARQGLDLHYEAAVGGGIPLIQPIKHQLAGNDILRMAGILNGTTNLILSRMTDEGEPLETVLAEAQGKGYAEADPSSDVDGHDVQFKLAILSSVAFGKAVRPEQIYREGIRGIEQADIAYAKTLGYVIKLLGIVEAVEGGSILGRVHPTLLPKAHPLAAVGGVYNALCLRGDFVGDVTFMGRGAGGEATGSAVVGDLIDVCRNMRIGGSGDAAPFSGEANARPIEELTSAYYVRVVVPDRPLVLGAIATIFGRRNVSLSAMEMRVIDTKLNHGEIAFLTHRCLEADLRQAVEELRHAPEVLRVCNWIRVETL